MEVELVVLEIEGSSCSQVEEHPPHKREVAGLILAGCCLVFFLLSSDSNHLLLKRREATIRTLLGLNPAIAHKVRNLWGRGGGLVDRAANSGQYDPSSIPLGEKKENKQKKGPGLAHI